MRTPGDTPQSRRAALAHGTRDAVPAITTFGQRRTQKETPPASPHSPQCLEAEPGTWAGSSAHLLRARHVEQVVKVLVAGPQEGPHRAGSLVDVVHLSLAGAVPKEGPVEAGIRVLHQLHLQWHRGNSSQGQQEKRSTRQRFNAPLGWLVCCDPRQ